MNTITENIMAALAAMETRIEDCSARLGFNAETGKLELRLDRKTDAVNVVAIELP